jgi:hypothetical protein
MSDFAREGIMLLLIIFLACWIIVLKIDLKYERERAKRLRYDRQLLGTGERDDLRREWQEDR